MHARALTRSPCFQQVLLASLRANGWDDGVELYAAGAAETANPAVGSKFDSIAAAVDIRPKQTARKSRGLSAATLAMAGKRKGGKRDADATK